MIEGAAILAVGLLVGWLGGRFGRRRNTGGAPGPVKPICTCGHARSYHLDGKGRCQKVPYDSQCKCQMYDGPQPLPEYFAPEIQP